ncbi:MAG: hypothetical protein ABFS18_11780 [Thermodesulfobacteriota bacterium]
MMKTLRIFHAVLFLAIFTSGCLPPTWPQKTSRANFDFAPQDLKSASFAEKIKALAIITQDTKTTNLEKAEAHRRLAILYLMPRNPDSDFQSAVDELGKFLELAPNKLDTRAAASWATALKSGEEYQGLKTKVETLNKKNYQLATEKESLAKTNTDLANTNAELRKIIEKLKKLDLSLEEKRRNLR